MRKFMQAFESVGVFYVALFVAVLVLEWLFARTYADDMREADQKVQKWVDAFDQHYKHPGGEPINQALGQVNLAGEEVQKNLKALRDEVIFITKPEYVIPIEDKWAGLTFPDKVDLFKQRNVGALSTIKGFQAPFLASILQKDLATDKANQLLTQASITEELFSRLEKAEVLFLMESVNVNPPKEVTSSTGLGLKNVLSFPFTLKLKADPLVLDRLFSGLRAGQGYFFIDKVQMTQGTQVEDLGPEFTCNISMQALALEVDEQGTYFPPKIPAWAPAIGLR